ncbi:hypothetical protein H9654_03945 [Stenotrophomonas sp. Sa5BUN4]|uniref:Uncharacterized protein n=1 Tax=Stenotrophomonas lacuserhaii TaxID=2760084 RepID=A0A8X8FK72_9GAMM|nr:hypothetical protein [Stenotrophomonas pennii]MBD7953353.1 hypothetical protein [Stenotrophomonas pennii]
MNFGQQLFASSWVKQDGEDIVQWSMYGDDKRGVRISLPDDPFQWHMLDGSYGIPGTDIKWTFDNVEAPYSAEDVFGDGYLLMPSINRAEFLKEVSYVEDVAQAYQHHVRQEGDMISISGHPTQLARFKWDRWKFQKEHRFVISAIRGPQKTNDPMEYGEKYRELVRDEHWHKKGALSTFIDLMVEPEIMESIAITLGPMCSEEDRERITKLCKSYAKKARVCQSDLTGKIRSKI